MGDDTPIVLQQIFADKRLKSPRSQPICILSFGTMNINALAISGSDSGAVPDDSTNTRSLAVLGSK